MALFELSSSDYGVQLLEKSGFPLIACGNDKQGISNTQWCGAVPTSCSISLPIPPFRTRANPAWRMNPQVMACSMPVIPEFLLIYNFIDNRVRAGYMASRVAGSSGLKPVGGKRRADPGEMIHRNIANAEYREKSVTARS